MPRGCTLQRKCSCQSRQDLCPVHVLWHGFFELLAPGEQPWSRINAGSARSKLRKALERLQVVSFTSAFPFPFGRKVVDRSRISSITAPTTSVVAMPGSHHVYLCHMSARFALAGPPKIWRPFGCHSSRRPVAQQGVHKIFGGMRIGARSRARGSDPVRR